MSFVQFYRIFGVKIKWLAICMNEDEKLAQIAMCKYMLVCLCNNELNSKGRQFINDTIKRLENDVGCIRNKPKRTRNNRRGR